MAVHKMTGEILVELGMINEEQLAAALNEQHENKEKIGWILVRKGYVTEQQMLEAVALVLGIQLIEIGKMNLDTEVLKLLPQRLIRLYNILPVFRRKNRLTLAMADPLNQQAIDDVRMATGLDVTPVLASEKELDVAIRQYLAFQIDPKIEQILGELTQETEAASPSREIQMVRVTDDAPVIRMVNSLLVQAAQGRASDIHLEPQEKDVRVRFRVDGKLYAVLSLPKVIQPAIVSRIKIMGSMDIAEKRVPQDGRFRMVIEEREVDFRVSTIPASHGEKMVLRILDRSNSLTNIDQLGFSVRNKEYVLALCRRPYGLVLVTGPTGSGKTTTMYSLLGELNAVDKNIITLEDPIEFTLSGINQVQTNYKAGLSFASGLKSILRQDPDIIMVGEIRDYETSQLGVQAALTGHLVLSTLHTNSAAGTVARMADMGIEAFLLANSLAGVISQRLVRQLCPNCKQSYVLDGKTAAQLGIPEESGNVFYHPVGCNMCRQLGYQGRIALHEIMILGPKVKNLIHNGEKSENLIQKAGREEGMATIKEDGVQKAKQGKTSLEEIMKVVLLGG